MLSEQVDAVLAAQPWFARLRPDERVRLGSRLQVRLLGEGGPLVLSQDQPAMVVVVEGEVHLSGDREGTLFPGDAVGVRSLCTQRGLSISLQARSATLLLCDRPAFEQILADFPAVAPALLSELLQELQWKNNLLREASLAHAEGLPSEQLAEVLRRRRLKLENRRRVSVRRATRVVLRRLLIDPLREPAFFTLIGFILALSIARAVVGEIIATGAQKHFFALIGGAQGNPIHIHHFNYGIALVTLTGIAALHPRARQALRFLGFTFGFGCGLVTDEFALLWNLNPDYYQGSSRLAMLVVGAILVQFVYLRGVYQRLGRQLWRRLIGWLSRHRGRR